MTNVLERAWNVALELAFPPRCALCDAAGAPLCDACIDGLPAAASRRCDRCWMPVGAGPLCRHCTEVPPAFATVRTAYVMEGDARRLAHELKYEGMTSLAAPMARLMVEACALPPLDVVVPVPLHPRRERSRGYNQAVELARHISRATGIALDPRCLRRTVDTRPLAKTMHREERRSIMLGAFTTVRPQQGLRALVIDDVVTTGATFDACATALIAAGVAEVHCLAWARAD